MGPRDGDGDAGAGGAFDFEGAVEFLGAGAHVGKAVAFAGRWIEAGAVVGDFDGEVCGGRSESEFEFGGAGVFDDVVHGFADDEEELMAEGGGEVAGFDLGGLRLGRGSRGGSGGWRLVRDR